MVDIIDGACMAVRISCDSTLLSTVVVFQATYQQYHRPVHFEPIFSAWECIALSCDAGFDHSVTSNVRITCVLLNFSLRTTPTWAVVSERDAARFKWRASPVSAVSVMQQSPIRNKYQSVTENAISNFVADSLNLPLSMAEILSNVAIATLVLGLLLILPSIMGLFRGNKFNVEGKVGFRWSNP